jgi:glucose 1-dehydrogenase
MSASQKPFTVPVECPPRKIQPVLKGQKALVTGASKGIGAGIALGLAQAGADVLVNYFSDSNGAEQVAADIRELGRKAFSFQADVAKEPDVLAMFDFMKQKLGRIDILISNSGVQLNAPFDQMSLADWQRVIDINLTGMFLCSRESVRAFKRQGLNRDISCALGKIICISSVHDIIPWAGHVNYAAAKGGIMMLMKSMAQELAPLKIRINSLSPGAIRTPMNVEKITSQEVYDRVLLRLIPDKRIGEVEDCARAAVWLASDDSDYVHGAVLYVDGGMTLYPEFAHGG